MANDIGNITASLKLESAAFIREMTKASQATARSTSAMQASMAKLNTSFAAIGKQAKGFIAGFISVQAIRSVAQLGMTAIKTADDIAASARKIGVSSEDLQRWAAAAEQADVNVTELETAFRMFQRNLAAGKIKAEGDTMTEAFRNFVEQVAAAPTQIEKTALAVKAGGRNAQTILLLAASAGKAFGKELENAFVVSNRLIDVGDKLDDEWAKISNAVAAGFQTGFLDAFVGRIGTTQQQLEALNAASQKLGTAIGNAFRSSIDAINAFANAINRVIELWRKLPEPVRAALLAGPSPVAMAAAAATSALGFGGPTATMAERGAAISRGPGFSANIPPSLPELGEAGPSAKEAAAAAREAAAAERDWNSARQEGLSLVAQTFSPIEQYNALIKESGQLHLTAAEQARVQQRAQLDLAASYINAAAQVTGTLAAAFQDNKAFAIANAVMNVAQGITQALTLPFPLNWAQVAAVTAAGIAQISQIKSSRPGGGSTARSTSGGSGRAANAAAGRAGPERSVFIKLEGSARFTREEVEGLIGQLIDAQKDGAKLILARQ